MLYRQVYEYVVNQIERGDWNAGEKLPSVRQLALELDVNRLTVFKAYQHLKQEGKVEVKEKSGYYVASRHKPQVESDDSERHWKNKLSEIQRKPAIYQFSTAIIDPNLLPNLFLSDYVKQVFDIYPKLMGTYSTAQGDEELREHLSRYMVRKHRLQLTASELLITSGAQQAIDLIARTYIRPMDAIMVERPTYSAALDVFRAYGARFFAVDITPEGYDLEKVEQVMKQHRPRFFYMNPTFHNPTGYTVPSAQRKQLVELAERYRCLLIEDDAFNDMYFDQPPPPPLFSYDTEGWVVYIRSFCKYVAPGLRICAVMGRKSVIQPLISSKSLADNGTPLVNQKIFLHYFESDRMQQHLKKLRIALQIRRDIMEEELIQAQAPDWQWVSPKGGLYLWIKLPDGFPVTPYLDECLRQSVSFIPGTICDPMNAIDDRIRLCFSFVNESQLREGVRRLVTIARHF
ncbi:PLP-dependent aminotransferase family protein [Paenibacillus montanisoli]|uniref:PLP-dependent aminotransferase family protein n=1 Tax=Paenibacillus montanisoli TaxID=2081970 RepID=A0A328TZR7_9BACL|nr:PLP-dependent aminotransferase family protein [Paenibacillus montanisoli]RAP75860.1 PLP-dependent aminotransferase family protein [Paenibacillus montanisoli]